MVAQVLVVRVDQAACPKVWDQAARIVSGRGSPGNGDSGIVCGDSSVNRFWRWFDNTETRFVVFVIVMVAMMLAGLIVAILIAIFGLPEQMTPGHCYRILSLYKGTYRWQEIQC